MGYGRFFEGYDPWPRERPTADEVAPLSVTPVPSPEQAAMIDDIFDSTGTVHDPLVDF
jgi:hypothetical protein